MFNLANRGIVEWPTELVSVDEQKKPVKSTVHLHFRIYTRAENRTRDKRKRSVLAQKFFELTSSVPGETKEAHEARVKAANEALDAADRDEEQELLSRVVGWRAGDVKDGEADVPFSASLVEQLIVYDANYEAVMAALDEASRKAVPKNFTPGPDGKPAPGLT